MSFRRSVIEAAGRFDEDFIGSAEGEETEFCLRVRAAGGKLFSHRAARLVHKEWASGGCRDTRDLPGLIEARMHNYFHFNRKVRPSVYFKGRKLLEYYRRLVKEASATSGQRLLAAHYYFCRELIRRRDA